MVAERSRRNSQLFFDGPLDGDVIYPGEIDGIATIPVTSSLPPSSSSSSSSSSPVSSVGVNCIHHRVSKMDTLAGVAIKYGVEVADIKRLNGLVTDLQMFARKSLQIPLQGRHPQSPFLSNGSIENGENSPPRHPRNDVLDLIESINLKPPPHNVSPAMSRLQGYYGLTPMKRGPVLKGTEMEVCRIGRCCLDDEMLSKGSPKSDPLPSRHRKTQSLVNGFSTENGDTTEDKVLLQDANNSEIERSIRRRQKTDTPELLLEDSNGRFSGRTAKGIAPKPKLGSRGDMDMGRSNGIPNGVYLKNEGLVSVRKSSSTSCLQESDNNSSMWPTSKWILKPDVLPRPPKTITVRRNKAALD